jgi:hypothetical protein
LYRCVSLYAEALWGDHRGAQPGSAHAIFDTTAARLYATRP